jgi:hypothetical protein
MGEINIIDLSKRFTLNVDGKVQTVQALNRLNFTVREREVVALFVIDTRAARTARIVARGRKEVSNMANRDRKAGRAQAARRTI